MMKSILLLFLTAIPSILNGEEVPPKAEFIKENAIEIPAPSFIPSMALQEFKKYKVILVGEIHGTKEAPSFILGLAQTLATKNQPLLIGLEIPSSEQGAITSYLNSGDDKNLK